MIVSLKKDDVNLISLTQGNFPFTAYFRRSKNRYSGLPLPIQASSTPYGSPSAHVPALT